MFEVQNIEESANALSTSADPADFQPFQGQGSDWKSGGNPWFQSQACAWEHLHGSHSVLIMHHCSWFVILPLPRCPHHKDESLIPSAENRIG